MPLSHRERVIRALRHQEPDRVPFDFGSTVNSSIHVSAYQELKAYFGVHAEDAIMQKQQMQVVVDEPILQALDIDFRGVLPGSPERNLETPVGEDSYKDGWGIVRRKPPGCLYYDVVKSPLTGQITIQDIVNHPRPDPYDPGYTRGLRERILAYHQDADYAIVLRLPLPFVQTAQLIRGFEEWFLDIALDHKLAGALFDAVVEYSSTLAAEILKVAGDMVDVVAFSDDLGHQKGPMVSPEIYRKLFKPRHKVYFDTVKKYTNAFIHFHSCGSVYKLLDDLVELGVDALNPVQVSARDMDTNLLKREFGNKLSFWGAIDTQQILPNGTKEEVKSEVRRRIKDLAPGGGYILSAVHNIQPGVPMENIVTMYEAGRKYGQYPLALE